MNSYCEKLQEELAAEGLERLQSDSEAQDHLAACEECFGVFTALEELDPLLAALPQYDASDELVTGTLAAVRAAGPIAAPAPALRTEPHSKLRAVTVGLIEACRMIGTVILAVPASLLRHPAQVGLAVSCVFVLALASVTFLGRQASSSFMVVGKEMAADSYAPSAGVPTQSHNSFRGGGSYAEMKRAPRAPAAEEQENLGSAAGSNEPAERYADLVEAFEEDLQDSSIDMDELEGAGLAQPEVLAKKPAKVERLAGLIATPQDIAGRRRSDADKKDFYSNSQVKKNELAEKNQLLDFESRQVAKSAGVGSSPTGGKAGSNFAKRKQRSYGQRDKLIVDELRQQPGVEIEGNNKTNFAEAFLAARQATDGLTFKEAAGYWANTYLPGDPTVRRLHTALAGRSNQPFEQLLGRRLNLHEGIRQTRQPFDAPENAALAVFLHADQRGLNGERRMLLQVGLQGSSRRSGARPPMNVGVVLDMRGPTDPAVFESMKDLLFALNEERDIGDRFSVFIAGRSPRLLVLPEDFRHGPLTVTMQHAKEAINEPVLSVRNAIENAIAQVSDNDDPTAPLGSSVVLLVSGQSLSPNPAALETLAHQSAVAGIPVSTIAVGPNASSDQLQRVALAGQGNRRTLTLKQDPTELVRKELSAVSEVVARAVRLRIRLAPGVKLIDVLGSHRLDEMRAERVRQAEQSIDRRLSRNLGIAADRGEDEEGVQIVIPAFYADTAHVVLLDVVAPGPGPIADVTVRYKDLVQLKNGVSRANLTLGRNEKAMGPLERNVIKNLLAFQVSGLLQRAALAVAQNDRGKVLADLQAELQLLQSFQQSIPGFERDPDIANDIHILKEYQSLLALQPSHGGLRQQLVESLAYAGKMKVLPRPEEN